MADDIGIKIAKKGEKVTSMDCRDYNLWSKYPIFKVALKGQGVVIVEPGDLEEGTIEHNLGYNPICLLYYRYGIRGETPSDYFIARSIVKMGIFEPIVWISNKKSDSNNIYFYAYWPSTEEEDGQFVYFYYLMYDEGINTE